MSMSKVILLTGATDGIGLETARILVKQGHYVLLHGRDSEKLERVKVELSNQGLVDSYIADLSDMNDIRSLAELIKRKQKSLDVLINNAGVLQSPNIMTADGLDVRFVVNTIAPYLLTKQLLPLLSKRGRVINVSSAAQATVDIDAFKGHGEEIDALHAYSQSKLALTMWSRIMADQVGNQGPVIIVVNPGSLLGSKMVKEGFGMRGKDLRIGANILVRLAVEDEFCNASGKYFDNDKGRFANPHPDALDDSKCAELISVLEFFLDGK